MKMNEKQTGEKVKLWNPNAAANWSILFSPIFGAWIQAENWKALNRPDQAKVSMIWVAIGFVLMIVALFLPRSAGLGLWYLLIWYFANGKKQIKYIKENNIDYEKKSWTKPLLIAFGSVVAYFGVIYALVYYINYFAQGS